MSPCYVCSDSFIAFSAEDEEGLELIFTNSASCHDAQGGLPEGGPSEMWNEGLGIFGRIYRKLLGTPSVAQDVCDIISNNIIGTVGPHIA